MSSVTTAAVGAGDPGYERKVDLNKPMGPTGIMVFGAVMALGLFFTAYSIFSEVEAAGAKPTSILPYLLLAVALLVALGFEFVNGFHDTANAVATVIYTRALPPQIAVVWSGFFNFLGVSLSTGLVAYNIVSLLPIELILSITSNAGFAMVFSMLIAAIIWNLGTWWLGLPASSSHTLIGSIIGVGIMNALMHGRTAYSGVNWGEATKIGYALLLSPLFGFGVAALLLLAMKAVVRKKELYAEPKSDRPPPIWIRGPADPDLHAGVVLPRLERRSEGHGPHHAHPHRYRTDRFRAQPRGRASQDRPLHRGLAESRGDHQRQGCRLQRDRQPAPGGDHLRRLARLFGRHLPLARGAGRRHREAGLGLRRLDPEDPGRCREQHAATTCTSRPRPSRCCSKTSRPSFPPTTRRRSPSIRAC